MATTCGRHYCYSFIPLLFFGCIGCLIDCRSLSYCSLNHWLMGIRFAVKVRINNTLKNELLKDMIFTDINQVKEVIQKAIMFYNYERPHMSLEMRTPVEAATETGRFKRRWISYRERAIDSMNENLRIIKKATNDAG